jgi:hypothetical protein
MEASCFDLLGNYWSERKDDVEANGNPSAWNRV